MKIAIIGTGNVGQALAVGWTSKGHQVSFGSRDPAGAKAQAAVAATGGKATAQREQAAVHAAEVVVLAVPWDATETVVKGLGDLAGKVLIDATNPIGPGFQLAVGKDTSGAELVQSWATHARVVKAFNSTGAENMRNPIYDGEPTTMFICGDDAAAQSVAKGLAEDLGFAVADTGGLATARYLEPLAMVWIHLAIVQKQGRGIAFKLVQR
ncbi:MAG: NAD(P)-binding domain-containing protein [Caldilineaceae bacterium]